MTIILVVKRDRLVMSLHIVGKHFYKRIKDTELDAEVDVHKRNILGAIPNFPEV